MPVQQSASPPSLSNYSGGSLRNFLGLAKEEENAAGTLSLARARQYLPPSPRPAGVNAYQRLVLPDSGGGGGQGRLQPNHRRQQA